MMTRQCGICGRKLITGRKYCWRHRGYHGEEKYRPQDFKPSNWSWFFIALTGFFGLITLYSIFKLKFTSFIFYGILTLVCYFLIKFSKKRFKNLSKEYDEDPDSYNKKRMYGARYKLDKILSKPLSSRRTTNLGRPFKANAQSGIRGFWR